VKHFVPSRLGGETPTGLKHSDAQVCWTEDIAIMNLYSRPQATMYNIGLRYRFMMPVDGGNSVPAVTVSEKAGPASTNPPECRNTPSDHEPKRDPPGAHGPQYE